MLVRFARLAVTLVDLNDFFSAYAMYSGILNGEVFKALKVGAILNSGPKTPQESAQSAAVPAGVSRAAAVAVWSSDCRENMLKLRKTFSFSDNFALYKSALKKNAPCVPAISIHLSEIKLLDEGMPTFLDGCKDKQGNSLVNVQKMEVGFRMITDFLSHKEYLYNFIHVPQISSLLRDLDASEEYIQELSGKLIGAK